MCLKKKNQVHDLELRSTMITKTLHAVINLTDKVYCLGLAKMYTCIVIRDTSIGHKTIF